MQINIEGKIFEESEVINYLTKIAEREGYENWRVYLAEKVRQWSEEDFIYMSYQNFLEAVNLQEKKAFSEERWNTESTFEEWVAESIKVIYMRLDQLEKEKKERPINFPDLARQVEESEKEGIPISLNIKGIGEQTDIVLFEFYEEILKRSLETLKKFQSGLLKIPTRPSWEFKTAKNITPGLYKEGGF